MATLHESNATAWRVGDRVIHDADAKLADMLMVVVGARRDGIYRARYAFPMEQPRSWHRAVPRNSLEPLHDPRRFEIDTAALKVATPATASAPSRTTATPAPGAPSARS